MNIVTVYDIQNKFIAYSAPFPDVINIMCEWGSVYILGGDRKVKNILSLFDFQVFECLVNRSSKTYVCYRINRSSFVQVL